MSDADCWLVDSGQLQSTGEAVASGAAVSEATLEWHSELAAAEFELPDCTPHLDIHSLFLHYSQLYFSSQLGACSVEWSSARMTMCAGTCEFRGGGCTIKLSEPILKFRPPDDLKNTLLHEMIHAFIFLNRIPGAGSDGHGPPFKARMRAINASTAPDPFRPAAGYQVTVFHTMHDEVNHYRQHQWECQRCGAVCRRAMNRPPQKADCRRRSDTDCGDPRCLFHTHARTCGGTYVKVKQPEPTGRGKRKGMAAAGGRSKPLFRAAVAGGDIVIAIGRMRDAAATHAARMQPGGAAIPRGDGDAGGAGDGGRSTTATGGQGACAGAGGGCKRGDGGSQALARTGQAAGAEGTAAAAPPEDPGAGGPAHTSNACAGGGDESTVPQPASLGGRGAALAGCSRVRDASAPVAADLGCPAEASRGATRAAAGLATRGASAAAGADTVAAVGHGPEHQNASRWGRSAGESVAGAEWGQIAAPGETGRGGGGTLGSCVAAGASVVDLTGSAPATPTMPWHSAPCAADTQVPAAGKVLDLTEGETSGCLATAKAVVCDGARGRADKPVRRTLPAGQAAIDGLVVGAAVTPQADGNDARAAVGEIERRRRCAAAAARRRQDGVGAMDSG